MTSLIIDIRESVVRAVIMQDGVPCYARSFVHAGFAANVEGVEQVRRSDALELPEILKLVRTECGVSIEATHLILPPEDVVISQHMTPRISKADAEKVIIRKISAETKEDYPPFSIVAGASDQKSQTWNALYVSPATLKRYKKLFAANKLKLKSITTPANAMLDAFKNVREAIFNAHAIFEIVGGYIEAYYISSDGLLHNERIQYDKGVNVEEQLDVDPEKQLKQLLFKVINSIFQINSHYQAENPQIPVQIAWLCGDVNGLDEMATTLKEAMSVEVALAPAIPVGMENESGYVPLTGFASAIQAGTATAYAIVPIMRRFPLRRTYGVAIYALTAFLSAIAIYLTEKEYRTIKKKVAPQAVSGYKGAVQKSSPAYLKNLEILKKLSSQQFVLYPLFRELANELPDGVMIENIEYKFKDDKGTIVITTLSPLGAKVGVIDIPGKLMTVVDRSQALKNHQDPAIATVVKDKERFLKITITSEVTQFVATK